MKWFKHMTAANADDKLVTIRTNFGMWGVGCYWTILEMVASQMKANNPKAIGTFNLIELSSFLGCKRNKLETFLECLRNVCGMKLTRNGNIITIEVPKLLQIKDNYMTDLEETSKQLPSIDIEEEVEVEREVEREKKDARPKSIDEVESLWKERSYPPRESSKFWNYYSANGWRVGKNPMKDWKAAAAGWVMRSKEYGPARQETQEEKIKRLSAYIASKQ